MALFEYYEPQPPTCQATPVWFDTVDAIAEYFTADGFETTLVKRPGYVRLQILFEGSEKRAPEAIDVEIDQGGELYGWNDRPMLVRSSYVDPLTPMLQIMAGRDFEAQWRRPPWSSK